MSRLYICFLILSLHSTLATENKGSFGIPSSNDEQRIREIQNHLLKVQNEIGELIAAIQSGDVFKYLKVRLATLEADFQSLKQQLEDERRQNSAHLGKYDEELNKFGDAVNSLAKQLQNLENKIKQDAEKRLPAEIADEIRNRRFEAAESLLLPIVAEDKISQIVERVYARSSKNFDVLFDFAVALKKIDPSFYVLSALRNEMRTNNHRTPYQMIAVARAIENKVLSQSDISSHLKTKAQEVLNDMTTDIITATAETLMAAMKSEDYSRNDEVKKLANAVGDFQLEASNKVMQRIATGASDIHSGVSALQVLDNIYSHDYMHQKISGLLALFWKFKNAKDLNNEVVLSIADCLMKLRKMSEYDSINQTMKTSVDSAIENMPVWAKGVFFWDPHLRTQGFFAYLILSRKRNNETTFKLTPREIAIGSIVKPLIIPSKLL